VCVCVCVYVCVCVCVGMYVLTCMYMVHRCTEFHVSSCSGSFDTAIEANTWERFGANKRW